MLYEANSNLMLVQSNQPAINSGASHQVNSFPFLEVFCGYKVPKYLWNVWRMPRFLPNPLATG